MEEVSHAPIVPMVAMPQWYDRPINVKFICDVYGKQEVALKLEKMVLFQEK